MDPLDPSPILQRFALAARDDEPFSASADGYRPEAYLPITADEWTLLALRAHGVEEVEGRADDELRRAAFVLVDRMAAR